MFQFPGLSPAPYGFRCRCLGMTPGGFPHSGIPGSKAVCASPGLIAACRALHRLSVPRHPPCALIIFAPRPRGKPNRVLDCFRWMRPREGASSGYLRYIRCDLRVFDANRRHRRRTLKIEYHVIISRSNAMQLSRCRRRARRPEYRMLRGLLGPGRDGQGVSLERR